ncbi:NAD(P)H-binding protein [Hymenobacter negativus]|uniref:NAD(P)H-binding protein n=1 Tax=Hymenobacter negativus TaxID=2795026 RepID=A0ABS3QLM9_9BACT|nr:NAD(P)H-binding protein [Hymenobacter negativus]MBO2012162.1 NAD(P)H-binding protein [Hymenobacter negativus]
MNITLTGSLGNISRRLAELLLAQGHTVTVVSHNPAKVSAIELLGAKAAIGSVEDYDFVRHTFQGADAVYTMVPPDFSVPDYQVFTRTVRHNYAQAIRQTGVPLVVNLSSIGSALAGTEFLPAYENLEEELDRLPGLNVLHLRPAGFYSNFYGSLNLIRQQGILGNNFDGTVPMLLTDPQDIADAAAQALHAQRIQGSQVLYVVSDVKTGNEVAQLLGTAIGRPDLQWVAFSDEQLLHTLVHQAGFSKDAAQHYIVDMGVAIREGVLTKHYAQNTQPVVGKRDFAAFAQVFAGIYAYAGAKK